MTIEQFNMTKALYSEIESAGGLISALDEALKRIGSTLRVSNDNDPNFFPGAYARIEKHKKFSQIYLASEEKLYLPDFWRNGVCLGHGKIDNIDVLTQCIDYWLTNHVSTRQLSDKFNFVTPNKHAVIYDEGNEVQYKWNSILIDLNKKEIKSFVELAINDSILSRLFPFTSLMTLCFSRCTGYPFTCDTPTVTPIVETGQYIVRQNNNDIIGTGSAAEALKMVLDNLPKDIGPAVKGTAEDL